MGLLEDLTGTLQTREKKSRRQLEQAMKPVAETEAAIGTMLTPWEGETFKAYKRIEKTLEARQIRTEAAVKPIVEGGIETLKFVSDPLGQIQIGLTQPFSAENLGKNATLAIVVVAVLGLSALAVSAYFSGPKKTVQRVRTVAGAGRTAAKKTAKVIRKHG